MTVQLQKLCAHLSGNTLNYTTTVENSDPSHPPHPAHAHYSRIHIWHSSWRRRE